MALALFGMIIVWCAFPLLILSNTYTSNAGQIVAMAGQVNMWLALASSALGVFSVSAIYYQKLSVHELVFTTLTVTL